jgi:hypothetical protein
MHENELPTIGLHGSYRDVLRDAAGRITWDSGWKRNTIVIGCRRLIAALMKGETHTLGIQGVLIGAGLAAWDSQSPPGLPLPTTNDAHLQDRSSWQAPVQIDFWDAEARRTTPGHPTNILQIVATLGQNQPPWPENVTNPAHVDGTLREFGLVGTLDGVQTLLNEVRHVAIPKDPSSTLQRTIQLVF